VFILRLREVPVVDASGVHALRTLLQRCGKHGVALVLSGLQPQPLRVFRQMGLLEAYGLHVAEDFAAALSLSSRLLGETPPG
jgi:SulP family sulfate permease